MKIKFKLPTLQSLIKQVTKIKKIPWVLAEHAFLNFLFFLFLVLILSGLIFYKYSILAEKKELQIEQTFQFEEKTYQGILRKWQEKEEGFEKTSEKEYLDPFQELEEEKSEAEPEAESETEI